MKYNVVVIGANYGDEGKGRCVRWTLRDFLYIKKWISSKDEAIVIKHNGGSQAGHTSEGFVYHAYGSADVETYLSPEFIINPRSIMAEQMALTVKRQTLPPKLYIHENCRVSTPIDILCNHVIETVRAGGKHGSCGMGIYATITRSKTINTTVKTLLDKSKRNKITNKLVLYYKGYEDAIRFIPEQYQDLDLYRMMDDFYEEFDKLMEDSRVEVITIDKEYDLLQNKNLRIFETGQGLLLDKDCKESFPHVTPSHTNFINPANIIHRCDLYKDSFTYPVYCTRPYITKHGAGKLEDQITIDSMKYDTTNVHNEWQGSIRAAFMDLDSLLDRVQKDYNCLKSSIEYCITPEELVISKPFLFISWADHFKGFVTKESREVPFIKSLGKKNYDIGIWNKYEIDKGICTDTEIRVRNFDR